MIYLLAFLMNITTGLLIIGNPLLAIRRFGASPLALGALGTVGAGIYALACLGSGFLVDRLGFRKVILISCVFLILVFPAILIVSRLRHLFMLVALGSIGLSLFWPAIQRWLGEENQFHALRRRIGSFNICLIGGIMVGNLICGEVFVVNEKAPYLLSSFMVLVVILFLLGGMKKPSRPPAQRIDEEFFEEGERHIPGFIYIGWVANFACWFAIGAAEFLFPKLALDLGMTAQVLAVLIAMIPLGEIIIFSLLRRTHRWHYNFPLLLFFQITGIAGLLLLYLGRHRLLFGGGFLLVGCCAGMCYFSSLFYSLHRQKAKGTKSGFHESFLGMGVALGPLAGGLTARGGNLRAPYLLCILVFLICIFSQMFILGRFRRRTV